MDFQDYLDGAWQAVQNGVNDAWKVGKPMMEASLEQWGRDVLDQQLKNSNKELNAAVKEIASRDNPPGSFGSALSQTLQGTILQTYGLHILGLVIVLILLGMYLKGK